MTHGKGMKLPSFFKTALKIFTHFEFSFPCCGKAVLRDILSHKSENILPQTQSNVGNNQKTFDVGSRKCGDVG
jgi:hypothetical protein